MSHQEVREAIEKVREKLDELRERIQQAGIDTKPIDHELKILDNIIKLIGNNEGKITIDLGSACHYVMVDIYPHHNLFIQVNDSTNISEIKKLVINELIKNADKIVYGVIKTVVIILERLKNIVDLKELDELKSKVVMLESRLDP
ncbi:MAG: hypothetical protein QW607_06075 [Desulfurococcaceae archaeon]